MPVFVVGEKTLDSRQLRDLQVNTGYELEALYSNDLFKACLHAAGATVLEQGIATSTVSGSSTGGIMNGRRRTIARSSLFTQDPFVRLPDLNVVLTTPRMHSDAMQILTAVEDVMSKEEVINVEGAYLEGGNVIYLQEKRVLLHGLNPYGFYRQGWKPSPEESNPLIEEAVADLRVVGLLTHLDCAYLHSEILYHLDCYMQALPDGRLVVLNKAILSETSWAELEEILGDKLIDLGDPDYKRFKQLNFVSFMNAGKLVIVSSPVSDYLRSKLEDIGATLVTPENVDARSPYFNPRLAEHAAEWLRSKGYASALDQSLCTHLPKKTTGYETTDEENVPCDIYDSALGEYCVPLDTYLSESSITFDCGRGGPHCLVNEIADGLPGAVDVSSRELSEVKLAIPGTLFFRDAQSEISTRLAREFLIENRHAAPELQEAYDQQFGLVIRK